MTRLLAVYDGSNNLIMRFEYADARMPFAMTKDGVLYYLAYDQVGSLRVVADASGNAVKQIEYDSFGNVFSDSAPGFAVPFGFAGGLYDKDTKLVRFGYRDYDPDTGRWTAKDPIGFAGGDTDLYGYCVNDPVNWADPSGKHPGHFNGYYSQHSHSHSKKPTGPKGAYAVTWPWGVTFYQNYEALDPLAKASVDYHEAEHSEYPFRSEEEVHKHEIQYIRYLLNSLESNDPRRPNLERWLKANEDRFLLDYGHVLNFIQGTWSFYVIILGITSSMIMKIVRIFYRIL